MAVDNGIRRLLEIAGSGLVAGQPEDAQLKKTVSSLLVRQLLDLLRVRNGFYAFHSALLVRPLNRHGDPLGIVEWNAPVLWKTEYKMDLSNVLFFAEDLFGNQFCIKDDVVQSFDVEIGEFQVICTNIDDWANWILKEPEVRTAWPLAEQWGAAGRALEPGQRLLPKTPFVLGGKFELKNMFKLNEAENLRYRASIANQLSDYPDGSKVILKTDWDHQEK